MTDTDHREKQEFQPLGRSFLSLNLSFFLVFSNIALFYLYPLALNEMGLGHDKIGLVMGIFSASAVLSRPLLGKLVAREGEYRIISGGMALCFLASLAYSTVHSFGIWMLFIRIIHGIGFSSFITAGFSLAAKRFDPEKGAQAFGFLGAALMGAIALAPPFGEFLISRLGFPHLYSAASAVVILAWLSAHFSRSSIESDKPVTSEAVPGTLSYLEVLRAKSFLILLISTLIFAHCQATLPNFLALIAEQKHGLSGRFFFVSYSTAILLLLTGGKLVDHYGKLLFLRYSYPFFAIGLLLIPATIDHVSFLVAAALYGTGIGLLFPVHNALAADHGARSQKPVVMAVFTGVYDTGFITGGIASGWFARLFSLEALFHACGILALIGFLVVLLLPIRSSGASRDTA